MKTDLNDNNVIIFILDSDCVCSCPPFYSSWETYSIHHRMDTSDCYIVDKYQRYDTGQRKWRGLRFQNCQFIYHPEFG
jgi:hypothetical protein